MSIFNFGLEKEDRTTDEVKASYERVEKALSKLLGDAISDYNLFGSMGACDEAGARTAANYIQTIGASKEFGEKCMNLELTMYEKLRLVSDRLEERNSEIKDLQKQMSELKNLLYKIDSKLNK